MSIDLKMIRFIQTSSDLGGLKLPAKIRIFNKSKRDFQDVLLNNSQLLFTKKGRLRNSLPFNNISVIML